MSVRIRLARHGRRKQPVYRIVVADSRCPRNGRFLEVIGSYNPQRNDEVRFDSAKLDAWVEKGAQPSETVSRLIRKIARSQSQDT
ncbi:MAG: 30S ribosomal protein S16 [Nitrospirae bacterium]|nr:30S ribosomal protein S16 [Nitrospirota bacterium]